MARATWVSDPLATAMQLMGKHDVTLAKLNHRLTHSNRIALSTTVAEDVDATETTITVASAVGMPTEYPWFGRIVYSASTPAHAHWAADTVTAVGDIVVPVLPADGAGGWQYICSARAGDFKTHATTEPVWPTVEGDTIVDDQVTWKAYRTGDEVVKVTNITGSDLTVTRKARPVPSAYSGTTINPGTAAPTRVFKSGSAFHVLGSQVTLSASAALGTYTMTTSDNADDIIDLTGPHTLVEDQRVMFTAKTGGTGLILNRIYFVSATNLGATGFMVSATKGGATVNFTSNITAGTVQPLAAIVTADAVKLGTILNRNLGLSKNYGMRVFDLASRRLRALTLTVID